MNALATTPRDPVFVDDEGRWRFWYETWAHHSCPYDTELEARAALERYCREELMP